MKQIAINYQSINLQNHIGKLKLKPIRIVIKNILSYMNINNYQLSVLLCDNPLIQELNNKYRNKNIPTDVLSFESKENPYLGDLAISLEKTWEQSLEYHNSFQDELKRLLIHGILHLLGYDHEKSKKDEKIMNDIEKKLFNEIKGLSIC